MNIQAKKILPIGGYIDFVYYATAKSLKPSHCMG